MTDITALAQRMKAAAISAKELGAIARYSKGRAAIEAFIGLATPDNFLALVEALEKAQQHEQEWKSLCEAAAVDLDDWQEIDDKSRGLICKMADSIIALNERISELESRTVTVKLPDFTLYQCDDCGAMWVDEHETKCHCCGDKGTWTAIPVVRSAALAGVQVIEGDGQRGGKCE